MFIVKKIICILAIVTFLPGCDSYGFLEDIGLKEEITNVFEIRKGIAYLPNSEEPFTGKFELYYSNGDEVIDKAVCTGEISRMLLKMLENDESRQQKTEINFIGQKQNRLVTWWHKINKSQKCIEEHYKDGMLNGLVKEWNENGKKVKETNYKVGKKNGLTTWWHENGQKSKEINYKDGKQYGSEISWNENGLELHRTYASEGMSLQEIADATKGMTKVYDKLEDITFYQDSGTHTWLETGFYLYFIRSSKQGFINLRLKMTYVADNWLFINSFFIVADGQKFEKPIAKFKRENDSRSIWEWYDEPVSSEDLKMITAIIESKEATIRFKGSQYYSDHEITFLEKLKLKSVLNAIRALSGTV